MIGLEYDLHMSVELMPTQIIDELPEIKLKQQTWKIIKIKEYK